MDFQEQFDKAIKEYANTNQYGVSAIPAHTHNGADSFHVNYEDLDNKTRYVLYRIVPSTTDTSVASGVGGSLVMPFGGYINQVGATVDTAGITNDTTVNVKINASTIMTTKITINSTKTTSRTATTPPLLNSSLINFKVGDIFTFDVDTISTTPAKGLTVYINVTQTN